MEISLTMDRETALRLFRKAIDGLEEAGNIQDAYIAALKAENEKLKLHLNPVEYAEDEERNPAHE